MEYSFTFSDRDGSPNRSVIEYSKVSDDGVVLSILRSQGVIILIALSGCTAQTEVSVKLNQDY